MERKRKRQEYERELLKRRIEKDQKRVEQFFNHLNDITKQKREYLKQTEIEKERLKAYIDEIRKTGQFENLSLDKDVKQIIENQLAKKNPVLSNNTNNKNSHEKNSYSHKVLRKNSSPTNNNTFRKTSSVLIYNKNQNNLRNRHENQFHKSSSNNDNSQNLNSNNNASKSSNQSNHIHHMPKIKERLDYSPYLDQVNLRV